MHGAGVGHRFLNKIELKPTTLLLTICACIKRAKATKTGHELIRQTVRKEIIANSFPSGATAFSKNVSNIFTSLSTGALAPAANVVINKSSISKKLTDFKFAFKFKIIGTQIDLHRRIPRQIIRKRQTGKFKANRP